MANDDLTNAIMSRTEELKKLLNMLGQNHITEGASYKSIIDKLQEDLVNRSRIDETKKTGMCTDPITFYIINDLKQENSQLKAKIKQMQKNATDFDQTVLSVNYANAVKEYKAFEERMTAEYDNAEQMAKEYRQMYEKMRAENEELKENNGYNNESLKLAIADYKEKIDGYVVEEEKYKEKIFELESQCIELTEKNNLATKNIESLNSEINELKMNIKNIRNELIDLKGQIRVFCRVRPRLTPENEIYPISMTENAITIDRSKFVFDEMFKPDAMQTQIFAEVDFLIDSVYDGYNACIFAYGQTGSGKTYTMEGSDEDRGILPRAVEAILARNSALRKDGCNVKCIANSIEIYNETIKDLLSNEDKKYEIKHEGNFTRIKNCEYVSLDTPEQAADLLRLASKNRSVGFTQCNDRSSRSHSIYTFNIDLMGRDGKEKKSGTINFIDLAGSERLNESGAQGLRLKETQNINKSLSSLGNVMLSLLRGEEHTPYRNSKLTYYLQNSFSGNARVLMFVNVSPEMRHINETLSSLRFAQKVSECKLGAAPQNLTRKI